MPADDGLEEAPIGYLGAAANEHATAEPVFLDEDAEGPLMDLTHTDEVLDTITWLKDPAKGLDVAMKIFKPDRSFFASKGGRKIQRSIMDEVYKVLQKPHLEQLRAMDEDRAASILRAWT
jgi:hypothetical protein